MHQLTRWTGAALLALGGACAQAASTFELRVLGLYADYTTDVDAAPVQFNDWFNDGDPQTVPAGFGYNSPLLNPSPLYAVNGSLAGAESTPGDYELDGKPIGQLAFSLANATPAEQFTINGNPFVDRTNRIRVNSPLGEDSILTSDRTRFAFESAWNLATPDLYQRYGIRLTDAAGGSFNDLIALDVIRAADGTPSAQIRRVEGDALGNRTITQGQAKPLADMVTRPGSTLADVDIVLLNLSWGVDPQNTAVKRVSGKVELLDADLGLNDNGIVGAWIFGNRYEIFRGEDFSRAQAGFSYSVPGLIPEPGSWALMLGGLGVVAVALRRRRG